MALAVLLSIAIVSETTASTLTPKKGKHKSHKKTKKKKSGYFYNFQH